VSNSGVTDSEKYLARLCRETFLRMWSYPNLFKDQGDGKELCDLLVVFQDQLLIFSDKEIAFNEELPLPTAWSRWYRKAVLESAGQVVGAERWLQNYRERVFMDPKCTQRLPVALPKAPRVHRILTCRGAAEACIRELGGSGSLMVTNRKLEQCLDTPFQGGAFDAEGRMFHLLDEAVLTQVLRTLDTVSDFVEYLTKREAFFRKTQFVVAAGEEDLLAYYLLHMSADGKSHDFALPEGDLTGVAVEEGQWELWLASDQRKAKDDADRISYAWDWLIEKFAFHILGGTQYFKDAAYTANDDRALRWMARAGRFGRRVLAEALKGALEAKHPPSVTFRRYLPPLLPGDPFWVFVVFPREPGLTEAEYRERRSMLLTGFCLVVKHLHPDAENIAGIAMEPVGEPGGEGFSEDFIYVNASELGPVQLEAGRKLHEEHGFFQTTERTEEQLHEFPIDLKPDDEG
jgi:hypothetical protein